jgi:ribosome-associated protein
MSEKLFSLGDHEFIELKNLIKLMDYVNSGGEAKYTIIEGNVLVNNEVEKRRGRKLRIGDEVTISGDKITISK